MLRLTSARHRGVDVKSILFVATMLVVFCIYAWTSAPGIGLVDSGELTTAAWCLGIAHPTGYPLYTLLGHLWQAVLPFPVDRSMILFSGAVAAVACGVLALVAMHVLAASIKARKEIISLLILILVLAFAFSSAAMGGVVFAEVYPLTVLIAALLIWLAMRIDTNTISQSRYAMLMSYLWGLGLGNHLTIVWFFPIVLFGVLRAQTKLRHLMRCVACVALGASINLYLPIRSSIEPLLNWGHPDTIARLIRHLSAWQYQVWMFSEGWGIFAKKLIAYLCSIPADIGWGLSVLAIAGVVAAVRKRSWLAATLIALWTIGTAYNMNYSIPDISTYFLTFYVPLFALAMNGFAFLAATVLRRVTNATARNGILLAVALFIPISSFASLPAGTIQRSNRLARDFTTELLRTLPENALVLQADWDVLSPCLYLQNVEGLRRDILMLDLNLMERSWYVRQQVLQHPSIFKGSELEVANFLKELVPFETGKPYQEQRIETAFVAMNNSLLKHGLNERPVYVRDVAATGHTGVGANFPYKTGAYFSRISSTALSDSVLDAATILHGRTSFSERERYLLYQAAVAAIQQGSDAMTASDTLRVRAAVKAVSLLSQYAPATQTFLKNANVFLSSGEAHRP
jgi:hypothetical protein